MSDEGKSILAGLKQIRGFFEQTSLLLRTIDDQMRREGWKSYGNTVTSNVSQSIQNPKAWLPDYLFRFFFSEKNENLLLSVSILIDDDVYGEYITKMVEPFVTFGYFDYGRGKKAPDSLNYALAAWYGYYGDLSVAGTIHSRENWREDEKEKYEFESYGSAGLPLVEIRNSVDVSNKIVHPLLDLVSNNLKHNPPG